jgi:hypothetical protein
MPSRKLLILVFVLAAASALADQIATADGIGPVKIGMSVKEAEHALGAKLDPMSADGNGSAECWITSRRGKIDRFIQYMIEYGKVTRIDVYPTAADVMPLPVPGIKTPEGIGVGSNEEDIRKAYGEAVRKQLAPYETGDQIDAYTSYSLHVDAPDKKRGMIFETLHDRVTSFSVGLHDSINMIEGCN